MKYLRSLTFFFLALLFIKCHADKNSKRDTSKYIIWQKGHSLAKSNFRGKPPWVSSHDAGSYIWFDIDRKNFGDSIEVHCVTYFIPDSSWYNPLKITDRVLVHETKHFDLAEISSRQFRKYLMKWKGRDYTDFSIYFENGNFEQRALEMQMKYDSETNHSLNFLLQEKWDNKIDSLLRVYKEFNNPVFRIGIHKKTNY